MNISRTSRLLAFSAVIASLAIAAPAALAADIVDIGYIDQASLASLPAFQAANRDVNTYSANLQRSYLARARKASQSEQARLGAEFSQKMTAKQRAVLGPLFSKAQVAIASIASSKNLSVVIDKRIVVYGGQDITNAVRDLMTGVGDPVPPVNTPPPSTVGFVDQAQIDTVPRVKAASDDFGKFKADQDRAATDKIKAAKTDADRNAVMKDYQKTLEDKQKATLAPMIERTRGAMSDVAKKRGLALVIDRGNIIYGGTDITADVVSALK